MDYKKILKTSKSRVAVLNALRFLPDSIMLPLQYRMKLGRKLNLKNPQRFTEKLQWYKMNYRNPVMHKRNFYDRNWNNLHVTSDCPASDREIERPENLDEMLKVAEKLSEDFPYVRVDLYSVDGKVYFGELTIYPWSGYVQYTPDETDYRFGEDFNLIKWGGDYLIISKIHQNTSDYVEAA